MPQYKVFSLGTEARKYQRSQRKAGFKTEYTFFSGPSPEHVITSYSAQEQKLMDKIVPLVQWNTECRPEFKIKGKTGFVMPVYAGGHWKRTKKELIKIYI